MLRPLDLRRLMLLALLSSQLRRAVVWPAETRRVFILVSDSDLLGSWLSVRAQGLIE